MNSIFKIRFLVRKNLPALYLVLTTAGVAAFSATDNLYWDDSGFSIVAISWMSAVFNAGVSLAELPFAIAFDNYSNRTSLQVGNLLRILAFIIFLWNGDLPWILVGQFLAGLGFAASSGASEALILNQLPRTIGDESQEMLLGYSKINLISSVTALLIGSAGIVLYMIRPSNIWMLAIVCFVGATVSLSLLPGQKVREARIPLGEFLLGLRRVFKIRSVYLALLANSAAVSPFILWQIKIGSSSLGFLFLGFVAMKFFAALSSPVLGRVKVSPGLLYLICVYNIVFIYLFAQTGDTVFSVIFFGLHVFGQAMVIIVCYGKLHSDIDNSMRASATSIVSLMDSLVVVVVAPVAGYLATEYSMGVSMILSIVFYALISFCVFLMREEIDFKKCGKA